MAVLMRQSFLSLRSVSSNLVISLRLRTPFIFMTMKVLKRPIGFLGGLPGPSVWKQLSRAVLAKLKSTFRKRGSRVSCSSCPAWGHLLSLDVYSKIRVPNSNINVRNFGTNQRAFSIAFFGTKKGDSGFFGWLLLLMVVF